MPKQFSKTKVLRELAKRGSEPFRLEKYLFPEQLAFVKDPAPFKLGLTTRRAGKTVSCAADLMHSALTTAESISLYITLSRSNAKRLVWPELKRINRKFSLKASFNESELKVELPNGAIIYCSGANDRSEIEKFRGLAVKTVYIDECQSFPNYIEDLINDVLSPALMDYAGTLCLIGTPGPIPTGFFYDASRSSTWKQHNWSFWDNPHIVAKSGVTHQELFQRELKRRGVTEDNPSIQREWFGKWVLDSDSLVFTYSSSKNDYIDLPTAKYTYILGIDIGYDDADALAVLAFNDQSKHTYLCKEVITKKQGLSELVNQIEVLQKQYDISKIVMDTGSLGKKIAEEIIRRYKIPVEAAEKNRKNEYIELLNDALRTGSLLVKSGSRFAHDAMRVEWDLDKSTPDKKVVSKRFHSDICDAVLYAWRCSYSFTYQQPKAKPVYGTKQWADEEAIRLEEQAMEHFTALEEMTKFDPFKY